MPSGLRTTGLAQVTLDDGTTGLGEGYAAVFAPLVFAELVAALAAPLEGRDADDIDALVADMELATGYWSLQGAARHAISAVEAALWDAAGKRAGLPVHALLGGGGADDRLPLYGSGGNATHKAGMEAEIRTLAALGIGTFKIRARSHEMTKTVWTMRRAAEYGTRVAVDMTQNLARPSQTVEEVRTFLADARERSGHPIAFAEDVVAADDAGRLVELRGLCGVPIAGGEIVTTPQELCRMIRRGLYDIAQPDATVIGGLTALRRVFEAARGAGVTVAVHAWGAAGCLMANYHAAFAFGGTWAEWPLPRYRLREALLTAPLRIEDGSLARPDAPGLGLTLTDEVERTFPHRLDAVYHCLGVPYEVPAEAFA